MQEEKHITASIVVYKENLKVLENAIDSFLGSPLSKKLYIIDNSPSNEFKNKIQNDSVEYIYSNKNVGFGKGHNSILHKLTSENKYHLILNPDVRFHPEILEKLVLKMESNESFSMIAPRVLNSNNELLHTARRYPSLFELIFRFLGIFKKFTIRGEYKNQNHKQSFSPDFVQGSFMLFKTEDLLRLEGFDERYFMYMEDVDICRKIDLSGKRKLYFPATEIIHTHRKGSSKEFRLFFIHISSIIKYFMKWGFSSG
jgi:GT2 family glycosyltransferase